MSERYQAPVGSVFWVVYEQGVPVYVASKHVAFDARREAARERQCSEMDLKVKEYSKLSDEEANHPELVRLMMGAEGPSPAPEGEGLKGSKRA